MDWKNTIQNSKLFIARGFSSYMTDLTTFHIYIVHYVQRNFRKKNYSCFYSLVCFYQEQATANKCMNFSEKHDPTYTYSNFTFQENRNSGNFPILTLF